MHCCWTSIAGGGTGPSLRALATQFIPWFCDSMEEFKSPCSSTAHFTISDYSGLESQ